TFLAGQAASRAIAQASPVAKPRTFGASRFQLPLDRRPAEQIDSRAESRVEFSPFMRRDDSIENSSGFGRIRSVRVNGVPRAAVECGYRGPDANLRHSSPAARAGDYSVRASVGRAGFVRHVG